jgi:predicted nucleic acid-binding protein
LEKAIAKCGFQIIQIPKEALFLAGKTFVRYRKRKGSKTSPLPDFFIGAHAAVDGLKLLTRDVSRITSYFPKVKFISPKT